VSLRLRTRLFVAAFAVGAISAVVAGALLAWWVRSLTVTRIERALGVETRLAAELISGASGITLARPDEEADRLAQLTGLRVSFIGDDGTVLGDSTRDGPELAAMENHGERPEIVAARRAGGQVLLRRFSTTTNRDTLYAAAPVSHATVGFVRLALPLEDVADQQRAALTLSLVAVAASLPVAAALAWLLSVTLARRVAAIQAVARRYATGDLTRPVSGYGDDELGEVARVMDGAIQEQGRRLTELASDRRHLRAILSGMVEGVIVLDGQGRLLLANQAARSMLRLDDSAAGRRYQEWMRQAELFGVLARALQGDHSAGVEFVLARDPSHTCVARASPTGGDESGAVLVLHDITDLRRADRVRRDFVANVSHELRTPLTAIRGYVEALLEDPPPADESRRFLEIIARQTSRMERLVRDLLRLARLDAGQETPELVSCDVHGLLNAVLNELGPAIGAKRAKVHLAVQPANLAVVTDPAKLHDVMRNLIENALKYSPESAQVDVEAFREDGVAILRVLDGGPGIPPADLARVFERFYRVDKSRAREPGGTGIGLAIVRHLVELLGGEVTAANKPEGGAAFTVRLPQRT
jgi:two-component system phosphate regulon sensor histidine kinase PhoR